MTCIVGLIDGTKNYIGGDRTLGDPGGFITMGSGKIYKNGRYLFGCCGFGEDIDRVRRKFKFPVFNGKKENISEFMEYVFAKSFCKFAKDNRMTSEFMIITFGKIFIIRHAESEPFVMTSETNFNAIGAASDVAFGSLFSTEGINPKKRIIESLEAASTFSQCVSPPFDILSI